ncbi:MAG TPA: hypothetical protein PLH23_06930 [Hyphomonadaceae bacterium]|nr:hypothetical protein [Hyphomonadaceae bacterium]HPI47985.1 hypothetical protein [Hyphomonadaceae bacterium]
MQVGGLGGPAAILLNSLGKTAESASGIPFAPTKTGQNDPAKPAVSNTSFPTSSPVALGAEGLRALQETEEPAAPSAADQFLELMKKSPEERLRDSILKSLGLTEDDLNSMPPEKRKMIEEMIAEKIKEQITPVDGEVDLKSLDPDQLTAQLKVQSSQYLPADLLA